MSTRGSLATGDYTKATVEMARENKDFVIGFIAQRRMGDALVANSNSAEDFLILTPGVGLDSTGDKMGQIYRTPREVITEAGCDIIIVGRGIYGHPDSMDVHAIQSQAERYRTEGWKAYNDRLHKNE